MFSTFRVFRSLSVLVLLSAEIIVTVGSYVAATVLIARVSGQALLLDAEVFFNLLLVSTAIIITLYLQGLYADIRLRSKVLLVQQLCFAIGIAFLLESMLNFFSPPLLIPRQVMLLGSLLAIGGLFLFRWVYLTQIVNRFPADKLLILGRSDIAAQLDQRLRERPELSMQIVGYLDNDDAPGRMQHGSADLTI